MEIKAVQNKLGMLIANISLVWHIPLIAGTFYI